MALMTLVGERGGDRLFLLLISVFCAGVGG